jgi:hypothetical protein
MALMARIFINYRRDDTQGVAGRLFDYLALKYSRRELFMDVDAMKPGLDFAKQLDTQVSQCHVLLAVIGPHWLDAHDQAGKRRLDNEKDYVRIELGAALKRDIAVIPVLIDGAVMPSEDSLSDDLKPLARRHALELRHTRFNADADAIVHALETVVPRSRMPWKLVAAGVAVVAIAAIAVLWPKLTARPGAPLPIASSAKPAQATPPVAALPPPAPPQQQPAAPAAAPPMQQPSAAPSIQQPSAAPAMQPPSAARASVPPLQQPSAVPAPASSALPAALPAGVKLGEMMKGIALRGSLYRATDLPADPANCQAACRADPRCIAWTYTQPSLSGSLARCSFKAVIPAQFGDSCCTSGIEREPAPEMRVPPPVPAGVTGAQPGIELEGGTYRYFEGADATPEGCQAACRAEGQCLAWDYVRPGIYSNDARCFLKNKGSNPVASPCCIAGFERATAVSSASAPTAAAAASGPFVNTDLRGSSYRNFDLSADSWALCQSECKAENRCLAWTAVHPGLQGTNARCWLKDSIPQPSANSCCTSGIERVEPK